MNENVKAVRMIQNELKSKQKRVPEPRCHMKIANTGTYNYRSLGIRHIRRIQTSRGGREGNNAFVKDMLKPCNDVNDEYAMAVQHGASMTILQTLHSKNDYELSQYILLALERGHRELVKSMIEKQMKSLKMGCSFSKFHLESLTKSDQSSDWNPPIREASVKKSADYRITPMHLACINPSVKALKEIYTAYPDLHLTDSRGMKPIHYAAVCEGCFATCSGSPKKRKKNKK